MYILSLKSIHKTTGKKSIYIFSKIVCTMLLEKSDLENVAGTLHEIWYQFAAIRARSEILPYRRAI